MQRAAVSILLLALVLLGCGEENVLQENHSFTGLWETESVGGQTFLLEFLQDGGLLSGNLYVVSTTGERGAPDPILGGYVRGDRIGFTVDYAGVLDTLAYTGTRTTEETMEMEMFSCFPFEGDSGVVDTCVTFQFLAHRTPSGF